MTDPKDQTLADQIDAEDRAKLVGAIKSELQSGSPASRLPSQDLEAEGVSDNVEASVREALNMNFVKALLANWEKLRDVAALIGRDGPTDGATRKITVGQHKLDAKYEPSIHVTFGGMIDMRAIKMPVTLALGVTGLILDIKDRQITAIAAGSLVPSVTIQVESVKIVEKKLASINLPGRLNLAGAETLPEPA